MINVKRHSIALLALLSVVLLSGCIGQTGAVPGTAAGVIIKNFGPDISEVFSCDAVTFSISVENVGGADAKNVEARIFGLGTQWSGDNWDEVADRKITVAEFLEKNLPEYGQGGWGDGTWDLLAPCGLSVDNEYSAGVRLTYEYGTSAMGNIRLYDNDYLKSNPEEAESIMKASGLESFSATGGPLKISLAGVARPLVYRDHPDALNQASVTFLIENVGQGKPYTDTDETNMQFTVVSATVNEIEDCEFDNVIRLPRTGQKSLTCLFDMPDPDTYTTIPVEIEIEYNYFVDSSSSVRVLKTLFQDTTSGNGENGGSEAL